MNESKVPPKATLEQIARLPVHGLDEFDLSPSEQFAECPFGGFGTLQDDAAVGLASAWKGCKRRMNGGFVHDHMVVPQHVPVQLEGLLHVADAQHGASNPTAIRRRTKPLVALHHLKKVAVRVLQVKVLAPVGAGVHRPQRSDAATGVLCVHGVGVLALDFANEDAGVAELTLEGRGLWLSARELPNLHACTSTHVQGERGVTGMHLPSCVAGHERRFCRLLKHSDVNAKCVAVPLPRFVHIGNADAHLLNATDAFSHAAKMLQPT